MVSDGLVVGIGEILWDMFPSGKQLGGAPANFAYHVSQFGCPGVVVSAIGRDEPLSSEILHTLNEKNIDSALEIVDYPTGRVMVLLDDNGIPTYDIVKDVAWDHIPFTDNLRDIAKRTVAVCFGSLAQRNPLSRHTIMEFVDSVPDTPSTYKIFDVNLRQNFYDIEILRSSIQRCNLLKINDEELLIIKELFGYSSSMTDTSACRKLMQDFSLRLLILTCGSAGSFVYTPDKVLFRDSCKIDVVDTVGAGDSFTASFVASLLNGADIETAHAVAVETSGYVCSQKGAMPVMPRLK